VATRIDAGEGRSRSDAGAGATAAPPAVDQPAASSTTPEAAVAGSDPALASTFAPSPGRSVIAASGATPHAPLRGLAQPGDKNNVPLGHSLPQRPDVATQGVTTSLADGRAQLAAGKLTPMQFHALVDQLNAAKPLSHAQRALSTTPPTPSIPEQRAARKTAYDKVWDAIGTALNAIGKAACTALDAVVQGLGYAVSGLAFALASPALLFGVRPEALWQGVRSVATPVFGTVSGVVQGAFEAPFSAAGVALCLGKNLFSMRWTTDKAFAVETFTQPLLGAALSAIAPLLYGLQGLSDTLKPPRPVNAKERESLEGYCPKEVIDQVRVVTAPSLIQTLFLPSWAGAFTIGNEVYAASCYGDSLAGSSIRHETVHTLQYGEQLGGVVGFLSDYYARTFGNFMTNGFNPWAAYTDVPAEQEAYDLEA
jgi:hypothetical protein